LLILASAVALVFAHGVWRAYFGQPKLKIKLDKQFRNSSPMAEEDELSMLKAELPNGGARVVRTLSQDAVVRQHQGRTLLSPQIEPSLQLRAAMAAPSSVNGSDSPLSSNARDDERLRVQHAQTHVPDRSEKLSDETEFGRSTSADASSLSSDEVPSQPSEESTLKVEHPAWIGEEPSSNLMVNSSGQVPTVHQVVESARPVVSEGDAQAPDQDRMSSIVEPDLRDGASADEHQGLALTSDSSDRSRSGTSAESLPHSADDRQPKLTQTTMFDEQQGTLDRGKGKLETTEPRLAPSAQSIRLSDEPQPSAESPNERHAQESKKPRKPAQRKARPPVVVHLIGKMSLDRLASVINNVGWSVDPVGVFHFYSPEGERCFTLTNLVEPGVFDFEEPSISLPGVSLILSLNEVSDPVWAYRILLREAAKLADVGQALMTDGRRQPLTLESIEAMTRELASLRPSRRRVRASA
jgi:FtsZ-interacting cell division protein ZipA